MPKIDDLIDKDQPEIRNFEQEAEQPQEEMAVPVGPRFSIPEWVKSPTGDGPVESYVDHVLNFNKSLGLARVIRGFTGILGRNLNLAVVDIALGVMQMSRERKALAVVVEVAADAATAGH